MCGAIGPHRRMNRRVLGFNVTDWRPPAAWTSWIRPLRCILVFVTCPAKAYLAWLAYMTIGRV
jgi:hypothetical protein